ncbi:MAG: hypothetical protein C0506_11495 [Anaerolinea sp.]|nr:hypothetical protein [Anaerolinea sp.]
MDSFKAQLFLHILAVIVSIGATFAFPFLQAFAERSGVGATRFVMQFMVRIEKVLVIPGSILVALFGAGLIFDDETGYKDDFPAWLMAAITIFIVVVVVDLVVQQRQVKSAIDALEGAPEGAGLPAAYVPIGRRIQMVGGLEGLAIVVITFLMVWKPGE